MGMSLVTHPFWDYFPMENLGIETRSQTIHHLKRLSQYLSIFLSLFGTSLLHNRNLASCNATRKTGQKIKQFCVDSQILQIPFWDSCNLVHCVDILRCKTFQNLWFFQLALRNLDCPVPMQLLPCTF